MIVAVEGLMCVGKSTAIRNCALVDVERIAEVLSDVEIRQIPAIRRMPATPYPSNDWFIRNDWAKSRKICNSSKNVLLDRYFVSTMAYMHSASQAAGRVLEFSELWHSCFEPLARPDLWIMVEEDPRSSFARASAIRPQSLTGEWATAASVARLQRAFDAAFEWLSNEGVVRHFVRIASGQLHDDPTYLMGCFQGGGPNL